MKKTLLILVSLILIFCIAGCSDKSKDNSGTSVNELQNTENNTTNVDSNGTGNDKKDEAKKSLISKENISFIENQKYTGKAIKPSVTVTYDGKTLKVNTDYSLSYSDNTKVGTAKITVTGKGNYEGTVTVVFKIIETGNTNTNNNENGGSTDCSSAGHSWEIATCTVPKTCSKCGVTEGNVASHNWKDATYTTPKTCANCQVTEGSPLERETQEIAITVNNWNEYFELQRTDIIPEKNAFGEYGTPEDMCYELSLVLKKEYSANLVSINMSIEFVLDKYLKSYDYDRSTGIGKVTNDYKKPYNNTDTALCNFNNSKREFIELCHHAGEKQINGKVVYYAYIIESVKCTRAAGTIVIQK